MLNQVLASFLNVKKNKPLVHHITNYVTVNDCANIVLALGGSPVMADDIEEAAEMTAIASVLVINIGTLNSRTVQSMLAAGKMANEKGIPVILDPVGIGATKLRTEAAREIIHEVKLAVIRGNMSEMKFLSGANVLVKGVDSTAGEEDGASIAKTLAEQLNCIVAITGKTDVITDGQQVCYIANGHEMLTRITGTGCMTTSLVGTYCGANSDYFAAAVAGVMTMGLAGEIAYKALQKTDGVGTYKAKLFDAIYNLSTENILYGGKINVE